MTLNCLKSISRAHKFSTIFVMKTLRLFYLYIPYKIPTYV